MAASPGTRSPYFTVYRPSPDASVRLVCLPHAGGAASFYVPVAQALAPRVEVLSVQYPGRHERHSHPLVPDIGTLADRIADALMACTDRPYALFGHSMGALVGFEVARRMEDAGRGPVELFASGSRAPSVERRGEMWHRTPDAEFVARVQSMGGAGSELLDDPDMRRMLLPALRNDYRAIEQYEYRAQSPLACPVTAFAGADDPRVTVAEVRSWARHTTGPFSVEVHPGGHFFLADHREAVLETVTGHLGDRALRPCP
ncbi:thioesterase II family protein [Streptomyces europaeiscabiei]|uniref:Alpha/beta fold hydrolase n=1 Tax=Streptomyces europaeiscabiei TaxID=146819 RepID=A0ABU4NWI7_9ACTN|nr:alpha/beta fold hydrolase [Streptomyces europaeiscabiei]MDX2531352.1 alpha/beta fold hydrolase [Streptomyces europaeiscabiei]MDX2759415.1 alpha/beta fold hydrolase [Streptomyces europaeiscabiei]MDX2769038.1 alpha/beta fold hydrolase [Streptomyces europaeiscabiei]MDX3549837.1 alpha/beta fold hydrolase [Streptomyces europaeiscabiei]MDX3559019.1 alpha/beta fold hydrolase [Streptomyces europaeiscabiei]